MRMLTAAMEASWARAVMSTPLPTARRGVQTQGSPATRDQPNALVEEALANNPDVRVAVTRVEQAAGYVNVAKAALRPAVSLFGTGGFRLGGGDVTCALQEWPCCGWRVSS